MATTTFFISPAPPPALLLLSSSSSVSVAAVVGISGQNSSSFPFYHRHLHRERRRNPLCLVKCHAVFASLVPKSSNPQTIEDVVEQAQLSIKKGLEAGKVRQSLQILLPVDQRQFNFLDTEPRDYPCSIKDEFVACCKVTTLIVKKLANGSGNGEVLLKRIGEIENEMDPVAVLYPSDKSIAAVVFPIAETLNQVKSLLKTDQTRPTFLVNPQWRSSGQVVSDFGFGPWKRQAEEFLATFEPTYSLLELRIGEASNVVSGSGGVVRLLKCFCEDWHIYLMDWDGKSDLIGLQPQQPTYKELENLVTEV